MNMQYIINNINILYAPKEISRSIGGHTANVCNIYTSCERIGCMSIGTGIYVHSKNIFAKLRDILNSIIAILFTNISKYTRRNQYYSNMCTQLINLSSILFGRRIIYYLNMCINKH